MESSNFGKDIQEAEQEFVQQFDPNSKTYHHGDTTPVPIEGKRVPDSMPTEYDPTYMQKAAESENIDYGEEYNKLVQLRTIFQDLKKVLNKVCPPLESILRIKLTEGDQGQKDAMIKAEYEKEKLVTEEISTKYIPVLKNSNFADKYVSGLETICTDAYKDYKNKEEYAEFLFFVKKFTQSCFSEATNILAQLKKIKAEYKPAVQA